MKEVVVVQACRTAIGDFGGGLKNVSPIEMGATVLRAVLDRSGVSAADVWLRCRRAWDTERRP
jgi:acetyl-CoA C-acetyltransferase